MKPYLIWVWVLLIAACASRGGGPETQPVVPTAVFESRGSASTTDATTNYRLGPAGFPVPKDAATVEDTPPDHTFQIERKQPEIVAELKVNLAQMGFEIVDEYVEDSSHTHWYITKEAATYKVTVAGDANDRTMIILTVE
ncbi:MAG: hypothetical protein ABI591_07085 [Kofleriaceae bacterium]